MRNENVSRASFGNCSASASLIGTVVVAAVITTLLSIRVATGRGAATVVFTFNDRPSLRSTLPVIDRPGFHAASSSAAAICNTSRSFSRVSPPGNRVTPPPTRFTTSSSQLPLSVPKSSPAWTSKLFTRVRCAQLVRVTASSGSPVWATSNVLERCASTSRCDKSVRSCEPRTGMRTRCFLTQIKKMR